MRRSRFDHIALAVPRLADAPAFLVGELGGAPAHGGPSGAYTFAQWRFKDGGRLEVLEPRGADGFLHRFLAQRGPGIHHVTFIVPSLRGVCEHAEAAGHAIVGYDDLNPDWREAFLHPKRALGIVVQLVEIVETRPRSDGEHRSRWVVPPGPPNPPPVTVLGLRMRARSRERAEAQWVRLLGAEASEGASAHRRRGRSDARRGTGRDRARERAGNRAPRRATSRARRGLHGSLTGSASRAFTRRPRRPNRPDTG